MANPRLHMHPLPLHNRSEIAIREVASEKDSDDRESAGDFIEEQANSNPGKWAEEIKINRERLFNYGALAQQNINIDPVSTKVKPAQHDKKGFLMQRTHLKPSSSSQTLRLIKHKITPATTRLKTCAGKENSGSLFLPQVKPASSTQLDNRSTGTMSFRGNAGLATYQQSKKGEQGCSLRRERGELLRPSSKGQLGSTGGKSPLNRTFNKTSSLSKFNCTGLSLSSENEFNVDHSQIMQVLVTIGVKQEQLLAEKRWLEDRVKELKDHIEKDHLQLEAINRHRTQMEAAVTRQEHLSRHSIDGARLVKKKFQNCQIEKRTFECRLNEVSEGNCKLGVAIEEEIQLIGMYQSVIEEVKGQLKIEKQSKGDLQRRVAVLRKQLKTMSTKFQTQQSNTREMFHRIFVSLDKWQ